MYEIEQQRITQDKRYCVGGSGGGLGIVVGEKGDKLELTGTGRHRAGAVVNGIQRGIETRDRIEGFENLALGSLSLAITHRIAVYCMTVSCVVVNCNSKQI